MRIAVFPTCLVRNLRPAVEHATLAILSRLGHEVLLVDGDGCCGQPAHSAGVVAEAERICRLWVSRQQTLEIDYLVVPSGSCTAMIRHHLARYAGSGTELESLLERTHEFSEFLVNVLGITQLGARYSGRVAYHPSCHLLRDLGVSRAPLQLLEEVEGLELVEIENQTECCGFGGLFSVLFPEVSAAMADDKLRSLRAAGVEALVSGDTGCLTHLAGTLSRQGVPIQTLHVAEILNSGRERSNLP